MHLTPRLLSLALLAPGLVLAAAPAPATPSSGDESVNANGMTASEQRRLLREDPTAHLDGVGRVYFADPPAPDDGVAAAPGVAPYPIANTFLLHSKPGSNLTIFIDVDGSTVSGTAWNNPPDSVPAGSYPAWDPAGDGSSFSDPEKEEVQRIWQRVAEDYAPFDIDVTTQDPGPAGLERASAGDSVYGTRALVTPSLTAETAICGTPPACGGVAYINVFGQVGSSHQPAWIFPQELGPNDSKDIAEAVSHEVGHNFSLQHDGRTSPVEGYYAGHNLWAPIMGVGYQRPVVQWSKGEYANANNTGQDDVALIAARAPYRVDEAGSTVGTAAAGLPDTAYLTSASDKDTFDLGTCSGSVSLTATGAPPSQDLDLQLELLDAAGNVLDTDNPTSTLVDRNTATGINASLTLGLASGHYFLRVDGVGNGTGSTGYTDYASIGAYTLTVSGCNGQAAPAAPTNLAVTTDPTGTSATVTWAAPVSDGGSAVTGYTASRSGAAPGPLSATTFTKTWAGLTPGASYLFSVQATNAIGTGVAASQSVTMPNPTAPAAPEALSAVADPVAQTAHVTWNPPAGDGGLPVSSYDVLLDGTVVSSGTVRNVTLPGFAHGSTHTVAVRAVNPIGPGPAVSATVKVADTPGAAGIGKARKGKRGGKKTASVAWTAPASDGGMPVIGYTLLIYTATGTLVRTVTGLGAGSTSYTARLRSGKYRFAVIALNALGAGPASPQSRPVKAK